MGILLVLYFCQHILSCQKDIKFFFMNISLWWVHMIFQLFEDITLPRNLPLSSRMISKGYSSNNLTADAIRSMDFSYGSPDTPPSTQQGSSQHLKKTLVTAKVSEERGHQKFPPIKSGRNSQNNQQTIPNHLGPLKKFHTVAWSGYFFHCLQKCYHAVCGYHFGLADGRSYFIGHFLSSSNDNVPNILSIQRQVI